MWIFLISDTFLPGISRWNSQVCKARPLHSTPHLLQQVHPRAVVHSRRWHPHLSRATSVSMGEAGVQGGTGVPSFLPSFLSFLSGASSPVPSLLRVGAVAICSLARSLGLLPAGGGTRPFAAARHTHTHTHTHFSSIVYRLYKILTRIVLYNIKIL